MIKGVKFNFIEPVFDKNGKKVSELKIPHTNIPKINAELTNIFGESSRMCYHPKSDVAQVDLKGKTLEEWSWDRY